MYLTGAYTCRLKQRSFRKLFGWWTAQELLLKYGEHVPDTDESDSSGHEPGAPDAGTCAVSRVLVSRSDDEGVASDGEPSRGTSVADLFASDVEDDWDAEDLMSNEFRVCMILTLQLNTHIRTRRHRHI